MATHELRSPNLRDSRNQTLPSHAVNRPNHPTPPHQPDQPNNQPDRPNRPHRSADAAPPGPRGWVHTVQVAAEVALTVSAMFGGVMGASVAVMELSRGGWVGGWSGLGRFRVAVF